MSRSNTLQDIRNIDNGKKRRKKKTVSLAGERQGDKMHTFGKNS